MKSLQSTLVACASLRPCDWAAASFIEDIVSTPSGNARIASLSCGCFRIEVRQLMAKQRRQLVFALE